MRDARIWQRLLGLPQVVIESLTVEDDDAGHVLVVGVRARKGAARRCGRCGARAPWYDRGGGVRRWRHLDFGVVRVLVEAAAPRVDCPVHGPTVVGTPWARHGSRFTTAFEDTCAWLTAHTAASTVGQLLRISWRAVTGIAARVVAETGGTTDRLDGLRRIGIDEVAYRKGQRYLTVVVDHDTGRLVWARAGRDKATVNAFFDDLGAQRAAQLTHVSADAGEWITSVAAQRAPQAARCLDPYHLVAWASEALDKVRRQVWNTARGGTGQRNATSRMLKGARWALWRNPDHLTDTQKQTLAQIQATNKPLYRAYLLKEQLREIVAVKGDDGKHLLTGWLRWASRSQLPPFVTLAATIRTHLDAIHNMLDCGLSNARIEANNTHLRLLTRQGYGYHSANALITMAMLRRGGLCPPLPGRS
ncbi:ISL3 family transposase [Micromonospora echinofusca]|uniref:ISL3 family transposase n=1 Tax=Micromonospora echinofusca TaxID=47858 RepID=A0ABS3W2K7_MICEH|nr:ISL3 family transposase [Micromonospora echinofusca]MBO4210859.1 ISL3 family transposase [Micromonospora echinofusca]